MLIRQLLAGAFCLAVCGAMCVPNARAQEWNKKTKLTFNQPVEIPGMVLPAGTYVFKLMDSLSSRNIVQIFNADQTHLFATILAINNYRLTPTDKTVITFAERPSNTPEALHAWFYPGDQYGQEFVYPKSEALALAQANQTPVLAMPTELASDVTAPPEQAVAVFKQAPIVAVQPSGQEVPATQVVAASPTPDTEVASAAPAPASLPKTAGELPLLALLGSLLFVAGLSLLFLVKRFSQFA